MKKVKSHAFKKDCYLLGETNDGTRYYLEQATFDCDWYWGGGYVETYTNNKCPHLSGDICSHQHFDSLFFRQPRMDGFTAFKEFFFETPFTNDEIWKIVELMKSFYIAREYSDMLHRGGAHYTENPAKDTIMNDAEYKRINEIVIPSIMKELYKILGGEEA